MVGGAPIFLHSNLHEEQNIVLILKRLREHSSAGSEHLPYKQRVHGSNPCAPTKATIYGGFFVSVPPESCLLECRIALG